MIEDGLPGSRRGMVSLVDNDEVEQVHGRRSLCIMRGANRRRDRNDNVGVIKRVPVLNYARDDPDSRAVGGRHGSDPTKQLLSRKGVADLASQLYRRDDNESPMSGHQVGRGESYTCLPDAGRDGDYRRDAWPRGPMGK